MYTDIFDCDVVRRRPRFDGRVQNEKKVLLDPMAGVVAERWAREARALREALAAAAALAALGGVALQVAQAVVASPSATTPLVF